MNGQYADRQKDSDGKIIPKQVIVCTVDQRVKDALDGRSQELEQTRSACLNKLLEEVLITSSMPAMESIKASLSRVQRLKMVGRRLLGHSDWNTRPQV